MIRIQAMKLPKMLYKSLLLRHDLKKAVPIFLILLIMLMSSSILPFGQSITQPANKSYVIFCFDGAYSSAYTIAFPKLRARGWPGVVAQVTGWVDVPSRGSLTLAQLREMRDAGWEIASHSETMRGFSVLNEEEIEQEVINSRNFLMERLNVPVETFVYPGYVKVDEYGNSAKDIVAKYHKYGICEYMWTDGTPGWFYGQVSQSIQRPECSDSTYMWVPTWINQVRFDVPGQSLILAFHTIGPNGALSEENFDRVLGYVEASGLEVRTIGGTSSQEFTLTTTTTVGGITDPAPGSYSYPQGSSVGVRAIPDSGYRFDRWELDGLIRTENPTNILMDTNHILTAYFSAIPPEQSVIKGVVTDARTGVVIQGATARAGTAYSTTTGLDGSYTLTVPVGVYTLTMSKTGYTTQTTTVDASISGTYTLNVALTPVALTNIIQNPGYEDDPAGANWIPYRGASTAELTIDQVNPISGLRSAKAVCTNYVAPYAVGWIQQVAPRLQAGQTYILRVKYRSNVPVALEFYCEGRGYPPNVYQYLAAAPSGAVSPDVLIGPIPEGVNDARLWVKINTVGELTVDEWEMILV